MNFIGTGTPLSGVDFARAALTLGCEVAVIQAVTVVEARGEGFDAKRRPVILFEPHVFYRNLPKAKRPAAVKQGLAYAKWRKGNYPATQDRRYDQLTRAMLIDRDAALMACSWGIGQVLGENWKLCGFTSVESLVRKCLEGEGGQLDVMVAFIKGKGLAKHLVAKNWAGFAFGYNGKLYAENAYDKKLATAYSRITGGKSTAYDALSDGFLSVGDKGPIVKALQTALGIHADGDFGNLTKQAVESFQTKHGLTVDGKVGKETGQKLGLAFWDEPAKAEPVAAPAPKPVAAPKPAAVPTPAPAPAPAPAPQPSSGVVAKGAATAAVGVAAAAAAWWNDITTWIGGLFQ